MAVRYPNYELLDTVSVQLFMSYNERLDLIGSLWYSSRHYVKDAITANGTQE